MSGRALMLCRISTQFGLIDSILSKAAQKLLSLFPLLRTKEDLAETQQQLNKFQFIAMIFQRLRYFK